MKELAFSDIWYWFIVMAVVSYFVGCFNFALLISKIKHKDVRKMGSGNPGTMNMSRQFGLKIGALTLFCDMIKGGIPLLIAYFIFKDHCFAGTDVLVSDLARYVCGVSVIIGHIYPVTMKFKGGKGIASTLGMYSFALVLETQYPWMIALVLGILVLTLFYIWASEWGSMGSLLGVSLLALVQALIFYFQVSRGTYRSVRDRAVHAFAARLPAHMVRAPQKYCRAPFGRRAPYVRQKTFARQKGQLNAKLV